MSSFEFRLTSLATILSASLGQYHPAASLRGDNPQQLCDILSFVFFNLQIAKNITRLFAETSALPPSFLFCAPLFAGGVFHFFPRPRITSRKPRVFLGLRTLKLSCSFFRTFRAV